MQHGFSEVTEKWKSYCLSLESFTQGNRPTILFPSSSCQTMATKCEQQKKTKECIPLKLKCFIRRWKVWLRLKSSSQNSPSSRFCMGCGLCALGTFTCSQGFSPGYFLVSGGRINFPYFWGFSKCWCMSRLMGQEEWQWKRPVSISVLPVLHWWH